MTIKELKEIIADLPDNAQIAFVDDPGADEAVWFDIADADYDEHCNLLLLDPSGYQFKR